jgi:hypothetical protein
MILRSAFLSLGLAIVVSFGTSIFAKTQELPASSEAPLEVYSGYLLVVQGSVGPLHGLRFLLDTGQTFSSIDRRFSNRFGTSSHIGKILSIEKTMPAEWVDVEDLNYAGRHVSGVRMMLGDFRYLRANGAPVDGVIGLDLLRRTNFRVDLAGKRVIFGAANLPAGKSVPLSSDGVCLKLKLEIDGRLLPMIADTGMSGIVFYQDELDSIAASYKVSRGSTGISPGGAIAYTPALVPRLRLGTQDLDREVQLVQTPANPILQHAAGYLGLATLHAKWIEFDFERHELRWAN